MLSDSFPAPQTAGTAGDLPGTGMPVLSEDSGEYPPRRLHVPGPHRTGGSEMEQNTKNGTSPVTLPLEAAACLPCRPEPAGRKLLSRQDEGVV